MEKRRVCIQQMENCKSCHLGLSLARAIEESHSGTLTDVCAGGGGYQGLLQ